VFERKKNKNVFVPVTRTYELALLKEKKINEKNKLNLTTKLDYITPAHSTRERPVLLAVHFLLHQQAAPPAEDPQCSAAGCVLERQTLKPVFHLIGYRLWV
jgi:hypothetical protein